MSRHDYPHMKEPPSPPSPYSPMSPIGDYYYVEAEEGSILKEYFHIIMRRKWWVIGSFLIIFLAATLYTFLRTPIYLSMAKLQITQDNPGSQVSLDDKMSVLTGSSSLDDFKQTQYGILRSRSLAWRVIEALNLQEHPDFKIIRERNPDKTDTEITNKMKDLFLEKLELNPIKNSSLVEVYFQSPDKEMAQKVVNAIADEYMYLSIDRRNESYDLVRKWLDKQLQDMAAKVQKAQKKLYEFGQKSDIYTLDDNIRVSPGNNISSGQSGNIVYQKFMDLNILLTKAQAERLAKEAQFNQIKAKGPNAPLIVNHPLMASLRQELVAQQAKVSGMRKVYRGGHPEMQAEMANLAEIRGRLDAEVQRLQESVKADYEAAKRTEDLLEERFSAQKGKMAKLQNNLTDYQILKRDAQTNEQLYQALLSRVKEASIASTMVPSNIAVIDPAELASGPYKPKKLLDLALGMVAGLIFGLGLAILADHLDDTVKNTEDLERSCSLSCLGAVPLLGSNNGFPWRHLKKLKSSARGGLLPNFKLLKGKTAEPNELILIGHDSTPSPITEAIRHVQTSVMLSMSGQPPTAILITSPNPEEGKSTLVSNLALSFALQGRPTVIIDGDLRKPRIHQMFALDSQPGLSNYLTGNSTKEEILRSTSFPNLMVITAGARAPNPGYLFDSESFKDLIDLLRQDFRHIIIDTPPILGFTDARIISATVDGVLLLTKCQSTHKKAAKLAHQHLRQINAPVIGVVLNFVGTSKYGYGDYNYHYNYKYYSKYFDDKRI